MTAADCWADLEAKARAATPGEWFWRVDDDGDWCLSPGVLIAYGYDGTPGGDEIDRSNAAFIAAANPATILKLIEAARHSQPGAEGGWQPIETHDGSREPVLLWFPDFAPAGVVVGFFRAAVGDCYYPGQWLDDLNNEPFEVGKGEVFPTHWMTLPASPQQPATSTDEKVGG